MSERTLTAEETKQIYKEISAAKLEPFSIEFEADCSEVYYEYNSKQYRLIYDRAGDWFCDIIFEGVYK